MQIRFRNYAWVVSSAFFILLTLACSMPSRMPFTESENASVPPTRTPLPTFTATAATQQVVIPPTPTDTPIPPPPTETPVPPTPEPAPTDTPVPAEPTATNTPEPPPPPPPAPAEEAPPPAEEPPPPPPPQEPQVGANGVIGKLEFRDGRNTYAVGEKVFAKIEATIDGGAGQKPFGVLGLQTSTGAFQTSWSSGTIDGTFRHEDGIAFPAPGNHKLWLAICFSSIDVCQGADGNWERFEPGLDVIVQ